MPLGMYEGSLGVGFQTMPLGMYEGSLGVGFQTMPLGMSLGCRAGQALEDAG